MPLPELIANPAVPGVASPLATLSSDVLTTPTAGTIESWPVSAAAPPSLRATGLQFKGLVGNEIVNVQTSLTGASPWTVERGVDSSIPQTHIRGDQIWHVITAGALIGMIANRYASFTNPANVAVVNSSFTVPPNITALRCRVSGGGSGGGGGGSALTSGGVTGQVGGAGGAAGGVSDVTLAVTPGQVLGVFVGFGGAGGSGAAVNGAAGGNSGSGQDSGVTATFHATAPSPPADYIVYAVGAISVGGGALNSTTTVQSRQWGNTPTTGNGGVLPGGGGQALSVGGVSAPANPGFSVTGGGGGGNGSATNGGGGGGVALMPGWTGAGGVGGASGTANGLSGANATVVGSGGGGGGGGAPGGTGGPGGKAMAGMIEFWW